MFIDSYNMKWMLQDESGYEWWEEFYHISLPDFEVIYENNQFQILEVHMKLIQERVVN